MGKISCKGEVKRFYSQGIHIIFVNFVFCTLDDRFYGILLLILDKQGLFHYNI